jgi:uncharacterized MAPEG superfamily protein
MFNDELSILVLYGLLVALLLGLKTTGMIGQLGMGYVLSARDDPKAMRGIIGRLDRALNNSVTALALFAPAILVLALRENFSDSSRMAAQVFLIARLAYVPAYAFGIVGLRTLVWIAGFIATVALYFLAL